MCNSIEFWCCYLTSVGLGDVSEWGFFLDQSLRNLTHGTKVWVVAIAFMLAFISSISSLSIGSDIRKNLEAQLYRVSKIHASYPWVWISCIFTLLSHSPPLHRRTYICLKFVWPSLDFSVDEWWVTVMSQVSLAFLVRVLLSVFMLTMNFSDFPILINNGKVTYPSTCSTHISIEWGPF